MTSRRAPLSPAELLRLRELLADEVLNQLSLDDQAELESLRLRAGPGENPEGQLGELLAGIVGSGQPMPGHLRDRLQQVGESMVQARVGVAAASGADRSAPALSIGPRRGGPVWFAVAASLLLAVSAGFIAWRSVAARREAQLAEARAQEQLRQAEAAHAAETAVAQGRVEELAEQLRQSMVEVEDTRARIARYESSEAPEVLAARRTRLLQVPGTIRLSWQDFDLPDSPAELKNVTGDVVWNDDASEGYLRFQGLKPNDPAKEQYQVWVIDDRGMEQRVSGGVFNASADGEVIVPVTPGIALHKVALFAVTLEEPGGTWVSNLKRRVVVAPRGS